MGKVFSNIHLCKNEKANAGKLMEYYHGKMLAKGYQKVESEEDADKPAYPDEWYDANRAENERKVKGK